MATRQARSLVHALRLSSSHTQCVYPRLSQLNPGRVIVAEHHVPTKVNFCEDPTSSSKWKERHFNSGAQNQGFAMLDAIGGELSAAVSAGFHSSGQQCMSLNTAVVVEGSKPRGNGLKEHAKLLKSYAGIKPGANVVPDWSFNKATDVVNINLYKHNAAAVVSTLGDYTRKSQNGIEATGWIGRNVPELVPSTHFSFVGSKASFTGNLNVLGKPGTLVYTHHSRCYSSKQKRVMMDKRNIQDHKRRLLAEKYEMKRMLYKAVLRDPSLPYDLREKFRTKLSKLPRNSSFVRVRNRCIFTARPRAVYRELRMSRIVFRELASEGALMGIRKASW